MTQYCLKNLILSMVTLSLFSLSSCSKSGDDEDWCLCSDFETDVTFCCDVNETLVEHLSITAPTNTKGSIWQFKYHLAIYRENADYKAEPFKTVSSLSPEFSVRLPLGRFKAVAWADLIYDSDFRDLYFHTDDFNEMLLIDKENYKAEDNCKMGYLGNSDVTVSYRTPRFDIKLNPAMGQYRIIPTDTPAYEVGKIVVSYPDSVPAAISAKTGLINYKWSGVRFIHKSDYNQIFDNVFANTEETVVKTKIEVYDSEGNLRARRSGINIPLVRGGITRVHADIYSVIEDRKDTPSSGGIGIDTEYDNDIFIVIKN